jgi:hypothetical protein
LPSSSALTPAQLDSREDQARERKSELFSSDAPQQHTLSSDFTRIASDRLALKERGEVIPGTLATDGAAVPVELRVRGVTSTFDLPLPKLKLKIGANDAASPFAPQEKLELGVHGLPIGGTGPASSGMGRELNDFAPRREAAAYAVLEELGLPEPATRVGVTTYVDTKGDADPTNDVTETHSAMLMESIGAMAKRWGGRELNEEDFNGARYPVRKEDHALLQAAEALVGNEDVYVYVDWSADPNADLVTAVPHNAKVVQLEDGWVRLVPDDFDLSGRVSPQHAQSSRIDQIPTRVRDIIWELPNESRVPFCERLLARKDAALKRLEGYPLLEGDPMRPAMFERMNVFFDAVEQQLEKVRDAQG